MHRTSDRRSDGPALELLGDLLGARERAVGGTQRSSQPEAEIFTRVRITKAFALKLQLNIKNYVDLKSRLEFGPFQGEDGTRDIGSPLSLERLRPYRCCVSGQTVRRSSKWSTRE